MALAINLTQPSHLAEEFLRTDWPTDISAPILLITNWHRRTQSTVSNTVLWAGGPELYNKHSQAWARKPENIDPPQFLLQVPTWIPAKLSSMVSPTWWICWNKPFLPQFLLIKVFITAEETRILQIPCSNMAAVWLFFIIPQQRKS